MKIVSLLSAVVLVLVILFVLSLTTLLPRARPESALAKAAVAGSPNAKDPHGFTILDWAARTGRADAIAELVRAGADPDLRDSGPNGWTPLHHAVHKDQLGAVRALLAAGADVNGRADNGLTPLMLASAQGETAIVEELLRAGANPRLRLHDPIRWSALEEAVANGHSEVVDALLRKDPELRLGDGPRGFAIRAFAWVQGHTDAIEKADHGREFF
ncbi:MAG TPA: ankyrin repeat domain-containing protein [Thermoanaerobaculia bacterium]